MNQTCSEPAPLYNGPAVMGQSRPATSAPQPQQVGGVRSSTPGQPQQQPHVLFVQQALPNMAVQQPNGPVCTAVGNAPLPITQQPVAAHPQPVGHVVAVSHFQNGMPMQHVHEPQQQQQQQQVFFRPVQQTVGQPQLIHQGAVVGGGIVQPAHVVHEGGAGGAMMPVVGHVQPAPLQHVPAAALHAGVQQAPPPPPPPPQFTVHQQLIACTTTAPAKPHHVQRLERMLDINPFLNQVEALLASPIRIPNRSLAPASGNSALPQHRPPSSVFSVKGLWPTESEHKEAVANLYNFKQVDANRAWLQEILEEESESESDGEAPITEEDLKIMCKIHRARRKYQKNYHHDIMNSQYTYYGAGLLSEEDRHPAHQQYIIEQYAFGCQPDGHTLLTSDELDAKLGTARSASTTATAVVNAVGNAGSAESSESPAIGGSVDAGHSSGTNNMAAAAQTAPVVAHAPPPFFTVTGMPDHPMHMHQPPVLPHHFGPCTSAAQLRVTSGAMSTAAKRSQSGAAGDGGAKAGGGQAVKRRRRVPAKTSALRHKHMEETTARVAGLGRLISEQGGAMRISPVQARAASSSSTASAASGAQCGLATMPLTTAATAPFARSSSTTVPHSDSTEAKPFDTALQQPAAASAAPTAVPSVVRPPVAEATEQSAAGGDVKPEVTDEAHSRPPDDTGDTTAPIAKAEHEEHAVGAAE